MVEVVERVTLFHVTRAVPYNLNAGLVVGSKLSCGDRHNPFFGFFDSPKEATVTNPDGSTRKVPLLAYLNEVREGKLVPGQDPFGTAYDLASHFQKLARELQMEVIRLETNPAAPSRQTCLWVTDNLDQAERWRTTLGAGGRLLEMIATGTLHRADAALLPADAISLSAMTDNIRRYWRGETTTEAQPELLFHGQADVVGEHGPPAVLAPGY